MNCPACGKENPFGALFCKACGYDLSSASGEGQGVEPPQPQVIQCSCGASNPPEAKFCYQCGNSLVPHILPAQARVILPDNSEILLNAPEVEINRENLMDKGVGPKEYMKISQKHCKITREGDQYYIEDVGTHGRGSTNGTYIPRIGEIKGMGKVLLMDGDEIILGTAVRIHFKLS